MDKKSNSQEQKNEVVNPLTMSNDYCKAVAEAEKNNAIAKHLEGMRDSLAVASIKTLKDAVFSLATSFSLGERKDIAECRILFIIKSRELYKGDMDNEGKPFKSFEKWAKAKLEGKMSKSTFMEKASIGEYVTSDGMGSVFVKQGEKDFSYSALKLLTQGTVITEIISAINEGKISPDMKVEEVAEKVKYYKKKGRIEAESEIPVDTDEATDEATDEVTEEANTKEKEKQITFKVLKSTAEKWRNALAGFKSKECIEIVELLDKLLK